ncbi:hypothetical protein ABTY61_24690 [Kitasatospora sp. NPDC096128]|uniref:hypothetical protein n=1 Tax=Kitasatospora sp. NPDC096128 TaxID=3155547 RepID=UPI00333209FE
MNWSEPRDGAEGAEDELRVLLQEAVPALGAPDDRMERVFARAARTRRRRRNAGLGAGLTGGLVAAALAAAPAIAPAPAPEQRAAGQPGVTAAPSPSPSPTETGGPIRFPGVDGLTATLPPGWYAAPVDGDPHRAVGYLANQPFDPMAPCPKSASPCARPAAPTAPDRVLLTLRLVSAPDPGGQPDGATIGMADTAVDKDCAGRNGDRELVGRRSLELKGPVLLELTACTREASEPTLRQVQQVLESIRADGR